MILCRSLQKRIHSKVSDKLDASKEKNSQRSRQEKEGEVQPDARPFFCASVRTISIACYAKGLVDVQSTREQVSQQECDAVGGGSGNSGRGRDGKAERDTISRQSEGLRGCEQVQ